MYTSKRLCEMTLDEMDQYCEYMTKRGRHSTCIFNNSQRGCRLIPLLEKDNFALKNMSLGDMEEFCKKRKHNFQRAYCRTIHTMACHGCYFGKDNIGNYGCILIPLQKNRDASLTWEAEV